MKMSMSSMLALALACAAPSAHAEQAAALPRSAAPAEAKVYFISPANGDTVGSTFTVRFGLSGMGIAPAGIAMEHTGHHHLLVDVDALPPEGQPLPNDARHIHFGKGQTETTLTLAPGTHTLQLILGDHLHIPHQPVVTSEKITVTVK
jgi:hypothetical protein